MAFKRFDGEMWKLNEAQIRKLVERAFFAGALAMTDDCRVALYKDEKKRLRPQLDRRLKYLTQSLTRIGAQKT